MEYQCQKEGYSDCEERNIILEKKKNISETYSIEYKIPFYDIMGVVKGCDDAIFLIKRKKDLDIASEIYFMTEDGYYVDNVYNPCAKEVGGEGCSENVPAYLGKQYKPSAVSGTHYEKVDKKITFAIGEKVKEIRVPTTPNLFTTTGEGATTRFFYGLLYQMYGDKKIMGQKETGIGSSPKTWQQKYRMNIVNPTKNIHNYKFLENSTDPNDKILYDLYKPRSKKCEYSIKANTEVIDDKVSFKIYRVGNINYRKCCIF